MAAFTKMRCLSDGLWLLGFVAILGVLALLGMITKNAVTLIGQIGSPPRQAGHLARPRFDKSMTHVIVPARAPNAYQREPQRQCPREPQRWWLRQRRCQPTSCGAA